MSFVERLQRASERAGSGLCIGLDTDLSHIPDGMRSGANPQLDFNLAVIEATGDLAAAYKLNLAFYEAAGTIGMEALQGTLAAIPRDVVTIGDAKRGDIANTAERYARALFDDLGFDSTTVNPYMGIDSMTPFFEYEGRGVFVLALTSNPGSADFQRLGVDGVPLYQCVITRTLEAFGALGRLGFVVGATHPDELGAVRRMVGLEVPLLIPGLGSQGGDAEATVDANMGGSAIYNVSRSIITAWSREEGRGGIRRAAQGYRDLLAGAPRSA